MKNGIRQLALALIACSLWSCAHSPFADDAGTRPLRDSQRSELEAIVRASQDADSAPAATQTKAEDDAKESGKDAQPSTDSDSSGKSVLEPGTGELINLEAARQLPRKPPSRARPASISPTCRSPMWSR